VGVKGSRGMGGQRGVARSTVVEAVKETTWGGRRCCERIGGWKKMIGITAHLVSYKQTL
jgi:hypothetical protein